ncbi:O-antigen ligase family protein [Halochromatium glycolicum]|uniref:O-antigen ligase-related domain-containing protein n=1 Tax=Halochromatium glycolicum TaxID=85075 RepID=A0AAJ0U703_9GAMM|nr:O-antigen ligase family protein [Halochromatium glycolicum]MBK1706367.1 hypothetical protein [Halochromatium glycolicum]
MLDLSLSHYVQLIAALTGGTIIFVIGYVVPPQKTIPALLLLAPFQIIATRYGSANMVLTYLLAAALLMRGRLSAPPLLLPMSLVVLACIASALMAHRATWSDHLYYLISLGSAFLMLWLGYQWARLVESLKTVVAVVIALDVLVVIYCFVQLLVGFDRIALFGVNEFALTSNWEGGQRLAGPFNAVGITAEFLVLGILFVTWQIFHVEKVSSRILLVCLVGANLAFLIATGNRGGFLTLIISSFLFVYVFRREIGFKGIVAMGVGGTLLFAATATVIITTTDFNQLFVRLSETETEGLVPDTRSVTWPAAIEGITERPILGHGPRFRLQNEFERVIPGRTIRPYPHNLYLFVLYTLGIVGFLAWGSFVAAVGLRLAPAALQARGDPYLNSLVKLFAIAFLAVLVDQIKVEFLRFNLTDYWHILFALAGIAVAAAERARSAVPAYRFSSASLSPRRPASPTSGRKDDLHGGASSMA